MLPGHVSGFVPTLGECLAADLAAVRPLSCVDSHMLIKFIRCVKALLTDIAAVWSLSSMRPLVSADLIRPAEGLSAVWACMTGLWSLMPCHVLVVLRPKTEALSTLGAHEGLLASMLPCHVSEEDRRSAEAFPALGAKVLVVAFGQVLLPMFVELFLA